MNRQTAIGLVVGTILSLATAFITGENRYYILGYGESGRKEISTNRYENHVYDDDITGIVKAFKFNNTLILLALIGGTGLGYLFSEQIEDKVVGIYRAKIKR